MGHKVEKIAFNGVDVTNLLTDFEYCNKLEYAQSPERVLDGTLQNENIDSYYIPQCTFSFAPMTVDSYSQIIQILNTKSFTVACFDYETLTSVRRKMYLSGAERGKLLACNGNFEKLVQVKFTMESLYAYADYVALKAADSRC